MRVRVRGKPRGEKSRLNEEVRRVGGERVREGKGGCSGVRGSVRVLG